MAMCRGLVVGICWSFVTFVAPVSPVLAGELEIEEPEVEKGEIELEYRGGWFTGRPAGAAISDDGDEDEEVGKPGELENEVVRQAHEFEVELAITEWLQLQAGLEFEQERNEAGTAFNSLKLSEVELAAVLELLPVESLGVGVSLFAGLEETVLRHEDETAFVIGPLVKAQHGAVSATGNAFFVHAMALREREIEDGAHRETRTPDHWDFAYAAQVRYQASQWLGFGAEAFGDVADIAGDVTNTKGGRDPRRHRLGPTLYFSLGGDEEEGDADETATVAAENTAPTLEATLGLLFGLSEDTSDLTVKWDAEIEF